MGAGRSGVISELGLGGVQSPELGVQGLRLEDMRRLGLGCCCRACAPGLGDRPDAARVGCGALGWETD